MRAVLSIGSNMDDRLALLRTVADDFAGQIVAASPVYATPPWGVTEQADFLNAVLIVDVDESPLELLDRCQRLENAAERVRVRKWGPRTLDVDIVALYDDNQPLRVRNERLTVPHPYAHERAFVLVPWQAADPAAILEGQQLSDHLAALDPAEVAAVRMVGNLGGE